MLRNHSADVRVTIEVDASLKRLLDPADTLGQAVRDRSAQHVAEVLDVLGIAAQVRVEISASAGQVHRWLRVTVNDRLCAYPDQLLQRVLSSVNGAVYIADHTPSHLLEWLRASEDVERVSEFIGLFCREVIGLQPDVLLGVDQLNVYRESLPAPADAQRDVWPLDAEWLKAVLARVLHLRIALADRETVVEHLYQARRSGRSSEDAAEDLVAALRPDVIEIRLPAAYLYELTTRYADREHTEFVLLRDGLFYELGMRYPNFRFVPTTELGAQRFAFTLNHLSGLPRVGLRADQCLVNDTVERLRLIGIEGVAAINPANRNEASLIAASDRDQAEQAGLNTWDQLGYLVLCLSAELRARSYCFVDQDFVARCLKQLATGFPDLVEAAYAYASLEQMTRVLRALIAEEIAIRNLRAILEQIVHFDFIVADPGKYIIFDERLPLHEATQTDVRHLTAYVRMGMQRYISHKYSKGQNVLIVYLLDPQIEHRLSMDGAMQMDGTLLVELSAAERGAIVNAVRSELGGLAQSAALPAILTSVDVRATMRSLIAAEFPSLPVLAYNELAPDLNIQPIARIELPD